MQKSLNQLLKELNHVDQDYIIQAIRDTSKLLQDDKSQFDDGNQMQYINAITNQFQNGGIDSQNSALNCISKTIFILQPQVQISFINQLFQSQLKFVSKDIYTNCLKLIINVSQIQEIQNIFDLILNQTFQNLNSKDQQVLRYQIEIIEELFKKYPIQLNNNQINQLINFVNNDKLFFRICNVFQCLNLQQDQIKDIIQIKINEKINYFKFLNAIFKQNKLYDQSLINNLINDLQEYEDILIINEILQVLSKFENQDLIQLALKYQSFNPNDVDIYDQQEDEYDEYFEEEDSSWKVRKTSLQWLKSLIEKYNISLQEIQQILPRLDEKDCQVQKEAIDCFIVFYQKNQNQNLTQISNIILQKQIQQDLILKLIYIMPVQDIEYKFEMFLNFDQNDAIQKIQIINKIIKVFPQHCQKIKDFLNKTIQSQNYQVQIEALKLLQTTYQFQVDQDIMKYVIYNLSNQKLQTNLKLAYLINLQHMVNIDQIDMQYILQDLLIKLDNEYLRIECLNVLKNLKVGDNDYFQQIINKCYQFLNSENKQLRIQVLQLYKHLISNNNINLDLNKLYIQYTDYQLQLVLDIFIISIQKYNTQIDLKYIINLTQYKLYYECKQTLIKLYLLLKQQGLQTQLIQQLLQFNNELSYQIIGNLLDQVSDNIQNVLNDNNIDVNLQIINEFAKNQQIQLQSNFIDKLLKIQNQYALQLLGTLSIQQQNILNLIIENIKNGQKQFIISLQQIIANNKSIILIEHLNQIININLDLSEIIAQIINQNQNYQFILDNINNQQIIQSLKYLTLDNDQFINQLLSQNINQEKQLFKIQSNYNSLLQFYLNLSNQKSYFLEKINFEFLRQKLIFNKEQVKEFDLGFFKHKIDEGLKNRILCFQLTEALLNYKEDLQFMENFIQYGLNDPSEDIQFIILNFIMQKDKIQFIQNNKNLIDQIFDKQINSFKTKQETQNCKQLLNIILDLGRKYGFQFNHEKLKDL